MNQHIELESSLKRTQVTRLFFVVFPLCNVMDSTVLDGRYRSPAQY